MPRNGSGTFTLAAGNPVTSGTLIEASWANTTLSDIASAVTDSLARSGEGGMTGPLRATDGTVSAPSVSFVSETATGFYRAGATDVRFAMAGVDVATLTTAGVTVGSTKVLALPDGTAAAPALTNTGDTNTGVFFPADNTVAVTTDGTERLRVDASGNLGLGVVPSAWFAYTAMDVSRLNLFGSTGNGGIGFNSYYATGAAWKYSANGYATQYDQFDGQHRWFTAPSGTAGNAISFTQAMTLDASGNLGVGTTSPLCRVDVREANRADSTNIANVCIYTTSTPAVGVGGSIALGGRFNSSNQQEAPYGSIRGAKENSTNNNYNGYLSFQTIQDGSVLTERARITSGGDLLVGTTSDTANVRTNITFNGATRNGLILVNTDTSGTPYAFALSYPNYSPNNTNPIINFSDSSLSRFEFRANGGLANYQANDVNLSDRREKTNFAPAKSYLDTICAIPVQTFNYIDQPDDDPGLTLGVVAQDVQAVAPELVMESNWGTKDNPKMRLSIYQTDLQYALMKCIQEQQAIIQSLTARIEALEAQS